MPKKKKLTDAEKRELLGINSKVLKKILKRTHSIIGLDLGTNATGFYHLHLTNNKHSFGTTIKGGNDHINKRIVNIIDSIDELLTNKKNILVVIEDYSFGLRGSSISQLSELGGTVKTALLHSGIGYLTVTPQTIKKFVLGPNRGKSAGKEFMLMQALDQWGIKFGSSDECDAFCLTKFLDECRMFLNGNSILKWKEQMFNDFITNRGIPLM